MRENLNAMQIQGKNIEEGILCCYSVFIGKTLILSESLRCEKVGWKREGLGDLITRCGGVVGNGYMIHLETFVNSMPHTTASSLLTNTYTVTKYSRKFQSRFQEG